MIRSKTPALCAAIALLMSANAFAENLISTEKIEKLFPAESADSVWIDNPFGNIEVVGSDSPGLAITAIKTVTGPDRASLKDGSEQTVVSFEGDRNVRLIRTILPRVHNGPLTSSVSYTLRVPRTVHVNIASRIASRIRVANINGNVTVNMFSGAIILDGVAGASIINTTNGKVLYVYRQKPSTNAQIQAVNADIDVVVPPDANFNWIADTLRGDVVTNLPVRAEFLGSAFRGTVNAPGGPTIAMQTLLGNIRILGAGLDTRLVRSARTGGKVSTAGGVIRVLYTGGPLTLQSGGGDITVRQAAGSINAETRSGDINITADPLQRTQHIQAHTLQGNIILNVSPHFGAEIDATVLTSRPDANAIRSDFNGLTIKREQVGSKTRIHATGKLNGGGDRVELFAEEGDIHISNVATSPVTVMAPP